MEHSQLVDAFSEFKDLKNIDRASMMSILEDVFRGMIKKKYGTADNFDIVINTDKGDLEAFRNRLIVADEEVTDESTQIPYSEAVRIEPDFEIGEDLAEEVRFSDFGRRAVLAARQNLMARVQELEKEGIFKKYKDRVGEIITGEVYQTWKKESLIMDDDGNELILPKMEQIPSDFFKKGDNVRAVVLRVEMINATPKIILSRTSPLFLERLFELEVPEIEELPENLIIEIVGNRKNIIFCEGEKGSYDVVLYQAAYPNFHIIPRGGCEKVIESTRAVRDNPTLTHLHAFGIIDIDYRTPEEIEALNQAGIYTIDVAEVENLFCIAPIIRIVAANQQLDPDAMVTAVTTFIINQLQAEFDIQVTNHAEREIKFRLSVYRKLAHSEQGLHDGMAAITGSINVGNIYTASSALYQQAIDENSLVKALKLYNRKNLPRRISQILGLANGEYANIVLRLLKSDRKSEIVAAIQAFTPEIVVA